MARQVFDNSMTAHVWAQQNQRSGRSNNGNLSFEGRKLFSYRTVIGMIMPGGIPLYTAESYSITTGGHMRDLHSAIGWRRGFSVPKLDNISGELDSLAERGRAVQDYIRTRLLNYLAENAAKWPDREPETAETDNPESATIFPLWLLRQLGVRDAAAKWTRMHAKAERDRLAAIEAGKRKLRDQRLATAKKAAATTPAMLGEWKRRQLLTYSPLHDVQRMALDLHHARGAAKAAGWKVITKKTAALLKQVRAFAEYIREHDRAIYSNRTKRERINKLREWLKPEMFDRFGSQQYEALSRELRNLSASGKGLQPIQRQRIESFCADLDSKIPDMRAAETRRREVQNQVDHLDQILRQAARRKAEEQRRADWFAGVPSAHWSGRDEGGNAYMRVIGDTLQTSLGAEVPLSHAVRVFRLVKALREKWYLIDGKPGTEPNRTKVWSRNGHTVRVGHFQVDYVNADGSFTAGCHSFAWDEIERVATVAGVFDLPPDTSAIEGK